MAAPNSTTCTPWIDVADITGVCTPATPNIATAIQAASDILYQLSGRQFPGICQITVWPCPPSAKSTAPPWINPIATQSTCNCHSLACSCADIPAVRLVPGPIVSIDEVTVDGVVIPPSDYHVNSYKYLIRHENSSGGNAGWPCCNELDRDPSDVGTFTVTYSYGIEPPEAGKLATSQLACEFAKAINGDDSCSLPSNVIQIARQGVTYLLSSINEVKEGITGLGGIVDLFIKTYNPNKLRVRSAVYSPDTHESFRHRT